MAVSMIDGHDDKITNYERIKNMSVEEMAEFLCGVYDDEEDAAKFIAEKELNVPETVRYIDRLLEKEKPKRKDRFNGSRIISLKFLLAKFSILIILLLLLQSIQKHLQNFLTLF